IILAIGGAAGFIAGNLFLWSAESFRKADSPVYAIDHAVNIWFEGERHFGLTVFFSILTTAAGPIGMGALVVVISLVLIIRKRVASAIFIVSTAIGGFLLNAGLKMIFTRSR